MEKIAAKNFGKIISHSHDEGAIYIVHNNSNYFLSIVDPISFEVIENLTFQSQPSDFSPISDNNNLYIPLLDGQIAVIDKFSGENIGYVDLGNSILVSQLYQFGNYIYCLCGVPITNGLRADINNYSVSAINKDTLKRERQSMLIKCEDPVFSLLGDKSCLVFGDKVVIFDYELSDSQEFTINFKTIFPLLESENYYICTSPKGSVEAIKKDDLGSSTIKMITTSQTLSPPLLKGSDELIWFMNNGVFSVNISTQTVSHIGDIPYKILSTGTQFENVIYCVDEKGILQHNTNVPNDHLVLPGARKVFSSGDEFFVATSNILYKLRTYHE